MINLLNIKNHALLKCCLTMALLSLALMFGPVILKPNVQANPGDKDKSQKPGVSAPTATGAISGIVTDAATSAPLAGVNVSIWTSNFGFATSTTTDSAGVYTTFASLETGTYFAVTSNSLGYIDELYDDFNCVAFTCVIESGTPISVTSGTTTTGVNFALTAGGRISGTVIDAATSAPLADVFVEIHRQDGRILTSSITDAAGNYISGTGLPTGTYYVTTFNSSGYIDELYDNIICVNCSSTSGTPIAVTTGATTSGINFALDVGGMISGTVTDERTGAPIADRTVNIFDSGGTIIDSGRTDDSGNYTNSRGLPAGSYYVQTFLGGGYINEIYDNIPCPTLQCNVTTGTPVQVTPGATTKGIDFALTGSVITGRVTDAATKMPLANVEIHFFDSNETFGDIVITDSSGNYTTTSLPPGSYYVFTTSELGYVDEVYNNIYCVRCDPTIGTLVPVTLGATVSNINFALDRGGFISGDVMDIDFGIPIDLAIVDVFDANGNAVAFGFPDSTGNYLLTTALPTGTYYARTRNVNGYIDELYKDMECVICDVTQGTPIECDRGINNDGHQIHFAKRWAHLRPLNERRYG